MSLPLDWNEWRKEWAAWLTAHEGRLNATRKRFPGKNFLADEILGTWNVNGRTVEISELTFPNLEERDERGFLIRKEIRRIGVTFEDGGTVVGSFSELERALGL